MRKILLGSALLLLVAVAAYFKFHHAKPPLEVAYAGNRQVTVWSTTAQVREPVTTVSFGEKLEVLQRLQDHVEVRTPTGITGWIADRELLSADLWQKSKDLETKAAASPIEARGHTKVLSNLHIDAGRDTLRIRQLNKDIPLDVLERKAVEAPAVHNSNGEEDSATAPGKKEDWWLVRAHTPDQGATSGWIMGRFIELDVPSPLPDYASSAGMRIVGWFELNHVTDAAGKPKLQYLLVGTHGSEGQPCDFSQIRVYTWGEKKTRYETAFVQNGVCGKLPLKVSRPATPGGEVTFAFENLSGKGTEERTYRMKQTVVRLVKDGNIAAPRKPTRKNERKHAR